MGFVDILLEWNILSSHLWEPDLIFAAWEEYQEELYGTSNFSETI